MPDLSLSDYISIIGTLATLAMTYATWRMASISKRTLDEQNKPYVVVYPELSDDSSALFELVIENVGTAPAYNVSFSCSTNVVLNAFGMKKTTGQEKPITGTTLDLGIPYLPVGKKRQLYWGQFGAIQDYLAGELATIDCTFYDIKGKKAPITHNILSIDDFSENSINTPYEERAYRKLEDIVRELANTNNILKRKFTSVSSDETYTYAYLASLLMENSKLDSEHLRRLIQQVKLHTTDIDEAEAKAKELFEQFTTK